MCRNNNNTKSSLNCDQSIAAFIRRCKRTIASAQVSLTTSIVFVTPLTLNYLLRLYTTPYTMFYKQQYFLHQQIVIII